MSRSKSSAVKNAKSNGSYRTAKTGRFIGERGRRATVERAKPAATTIHNRKAAKR